MHNYRNSIYQLLRRAALILILYQLLRGIFLIANYKYFSPASFGELAAIFFYGIRFDLATFVMSNALVIILSILPFHFTFTPFYLRIIHFLFVFINLVALTFNCIDIAYFRFTLKRSTSDIFHMMSVTTDLGELSVRFLQDYWYVVIVYLLLILLFIKAATHIYKSKTQGKELSLLKRIALPFLLTGLSIIAYRGGLQLKPVSIITAGQYTQASNFPLLLNTTFTIIKTAEKQSLTPVNYFSESELKSIINPVKQFEATPNNLNVVLIILESFSKEYIGAINGLNKTYTPFLDSLIGESMNITDAYANGKKSIEGVPAIVAGIPALMDNPYISSPYSGNRITSIASLLRKEGYHTSFFHGGTNGTMGLDAFAKMAGYEYYYGRSEYNNEKDFDGKWGIFDEPYFTYFEEKLSTFKQPFFSTLFTLSSHHPYTVPDQYKDKFKDGPLPILKSVQYTDYSLREFFNIIKNKSVFKNTLFIFTADHTSESFTPFYINPVGSYAIPLFFYCPVLNLKGEKTITAQQIDILPSIMQLLGYNKSFFSFGNSVFNNGKHFAINYLNSNYQYMENGYVLNYSSSRTQNVFHYKSDSTLSYNIQHNKQLKDSLERMTKGFIQLYNNSLINNKMAVDEK